MHKILFLFLILTCNLTAQTRMSATEAKSLRARVKEKAKNTHTITSDFVQYKHLDFLSNDIESAGRLAFKAPDIVKWEYTRPFSYSVLFKNEQLFINDDGNKSNMDLGSSTTFKQLNGLITASISGDMFIMEQFDISYFQEAGKSMVHFKPKDAQLSEFIKAFHIVFSASGAVTEVKMVEPNDDYTQIVFGNRVENQAIPDAVFAQ
ncbi:LolA family protein [Maribacter sp. 2304DJ31-5]|uniref:LolA family protein n=1 Tax=Maribacter sp. 2304DJ31-5 TaxID=3386273 RepID=UPI0039BD57A6